MKKNYNKNNKYITLSLITASIISICSSSANAQYTYNQPVINSVYATPMQRINEIPLYGKNKSMYLYDNRPVEEDTNPFANSGLYMFAGFSVGPTLSGLNSDTDRINPYTWEYSGGSDASESMGDATGFSVGVGRTMSSLLGIEFTYSQYTGMNYGNYATVTAYEDIEICDDDGCTGEYDYDVPYTDNNTYQVISGGDISTNFLGVGLRYNLEGTLGNLMGLFKPYVGVHAGITYNTVDDYTIKDPGASGDYNDSMDVVMGDLDYLESIVSTGASFTNIVMIENQKFTFLGTTTQSFGIGLELGLTMAFGPSVELDLFYKYNSFGTLETSGELLRTYDAVYEHYIILENGLTGCPEGYYEAGYVIVSNYETWFCSLSDYPNYSTAEEVSSNIKESTTMNFNQFGAKFKYFF